MSKLITAKIDVTKIVKALLYKGKKGTYLDLIIWVNDQPDKFGNDISIQQCTGKDDPKIYIGEGKFYVKKEAEAPPVAKDEYKKSGKVDFPAQSNVDDLPGNEDLSEIPF